jgi:mannose/fructose/N-acetylgalactosamine-specific phosphotransferase system component IIC
MMYVRTCFNRLSKLVIVGIDQLVSHSLAPPQSRRRGIIFGISILVLGFALVLDLLLSHGVMEYKYGYLLAAVWSFIQCSW